MEQKQQTKCLPEGSQDDHTEQQHALRYSHSDPLHPVRYLVLA